MDAQPIPTNANTPYGYVGKKTRDQHVQNLDDRSVYNIMVIH